MNPFKIVIEPGGSVTSVYSEAVNFHSIGDVFIHRATEVKFNNRRKCWEVFGKEPYFLYFGLLQRGFTNRTDAIEWEVDYLNKHMEAILDAYPNGGYRPREIKIITGEGS